MTTLAKQPTMATRASARNGMFLTYLRSELRRRARQAALIACGLAVGVGLVIAVTGAAAGVSDAQRTVLHSLYGIGTDLTITTVDLPSPAASHRSASRADGLSTGGAGLLASATVTAVSRLPGVASAAGGLTLTAARADRTGATFTIDAVDPAHHTLGPYASGKIRSGRSFAATEAGANVAVVDAAYAAASGLSAGSSILVAGTRFTVIGTIEQPQTSAPDVYLPLARAQALARLHGMVNVIYVAAASAADIPAVQTRIAQLLPLATITSSANLAAAVNGSLTSASRLASDLSTWLETGGLAATFAVASLLTLAAVSRRVRELGTLKALGWRGRRITVQIMAESATTGLAGAAIGTCLGLAAIALINATAPVLSADLSTGSSTTTSTTVHLVAHVSAGTLALAGLLGLGGSLIAGTLGARRAARLQPADAFRQIS